MPPNAGWDLFNFNYNKVTEKAEKMKKILYSKQCDDHAEASDDDETAGPCFEDDDGGGDHYHKASFEVSCINCYAYLTAGFKMRLRIDFPVKFPPIKLTSMRAEAFGSFKMNMDILVEAMYEYSYQRTVPIGRAIQLPTLTISTPVPITISPEIQMKAAFSAALKAKGTVEVGLDYLQTLSFGVDYRDVNGESKFSTIAPRSTNAFNYHPLTITLRGKATARVTLKPRLTLKVWKLVPIVIEPQPYLGVDAKPVDCLYTLRPFVCFFFFRAQVSHCSALCSYYVTIIGWVWAAVAPIRSPRTTISSSDLTS